MDQTRLSMPIGEAIKGHRKTAGGNHAQQNADNLLPANRKTLPLADHRPINKFA